MNGSHQFSEFGKVFKHPVVFIYILTGTLIIFLIILTSKNALEITLSGIAPVLIGIGANNFASFEAHGRDEKN